MPSLDRKSVMQVVNRYIGVGKGYLGDFSYKTHADFYPNFCDLGYDPYTLDEGTTREKFIQILSTAPPIDQAKILRGVIERFPVGGLGAPTSRTKMLQKKLETWADSLVSGVVVDAPTLNVASDVVLRALIDAEILLKDSGSGPVSAIDRIHTSFHGYLVSLCEDAEIETVDDESITALFKKLRNEHPKLQPTGPRSNEISRILNSCSTIVDALNPLRNRTSVAHPNKDLLGNEEATLLINVVRSLLHYINGKAS